MRHSPSIIAVCLAVLAGSIVAQELPPVSRLEVFPPEIALETSADNQSLVARVVRPDGVTSDVTTQAALTVSDPAVARIDGQTLHPLADGSAVVDVSYAGQSVKVPVSVTGAQVARPTSFRLDVMPVFMREGCNSGSCHGSARGQDGFRLSLFGFDPAGDHHRLIHELPGRRVNLAQPDQSLLLTKSTGEAPHSGGTRFTTDSDSYRTILRWLQDGAPNDPPDVATAVSLEILPREMVLEGEGASQRMVVRARYSDGTDRDVTNLALFLTSNDNSATIDKAGAVTAKNRGVAFVMARFATFTVGAEVIVVTTDNTFTWPSPPQVNYIDAAVDERLRRLRIAPSEPADDATFLRRVSLDLVGLLPTPTEYEQFVADASPDKRAKLTDALMARPEFIDLWTMKWAELLAIRSSDDQRMSEKAAILYHRWLRERIASGEPINKIVHELLTGSGQTFQTPAASYYIAEPDTLKLAENTAQVMTGMRLQCAQCHNHPFDRWTQNDYYGFASFFSQVGRKPAEDRREWVVFNAGGGEVNHPITGKPVPPTFPGGGEAPIPPGADRRVVLADWLTAPENPYFARNIANMTWAHFFGRGIVEPVDDVRVSNPPSNAALLDGLASHLVAAGFDTRQLICDICLSRTYQSSGVTSASNEQDQTGFSHAPVRRIRSEVLHDIISQVTESPDDFRGLPRGGRAVQIDDGRTSTYFLSTFGRSTHQTVCTCEVKKEPTLSQALHLLNGDTVNSKINGGGAIGRMLDEKKLSSEQVVKQLYVRCLTRQPTHEEIARITPLLQGEGVDQRQALADLFWALLNSNEFVFNH
jgi:hypothetical protein